MTIRNPLAFCLNMWDWACLDGCFGESRIQPTDIDGFVERNGQFLVLETKSPGTGVPEGQRRTFEALRCTGLFLIVVIWGLPGRPEAIQLYSWRGVSRVIPGDLVLLRRVITTWYQRADQLRPVVRVAA